ncbi:hypothetical protein ACE014_19830 [Shewanella xiamenensis]|uniref:hypothetical protein n=1 Tax=Shewanella xiamenensis TaxID=332186 RepID=UPI0035BAB91B
MEQQSYQVTQRIEGQNHQIAGRDIVNHWTIEPNQPKLLSLCTIEELRAQRDFSKEIIKDAEAKIWVVFIILCHFSKIFKNRNDT